MPYLYYFHWLSNPPPVLYIEIFERGKIEEVKVTKRRNYMTLPVST